MRHLPKYAACPDRYMSPEMLEGLQYDHSTDVFSFGVLLWEIAAAARPDLLAQENTAGGGGGPMMGRLLRLLHDGRRLAVDPAWPAMWQEVMQECWRGPPEERPTFAGLLPRLGDGGIDVGVED